MVIDSNYHAASPDNSPPIACPTPNGHVALAADGPPSYRSCDDRDIPPPERPPNEPDYTPPERWQNPWRIPKNSYPSIQASACLV